ncbi:MAG: LytR C-terminal domain-containing protein [Acidimicrobiales bacterium]|jgi:hypothetical protein|nr:LytR C-terminal domain-containing protein [Acidimicrobiales bacterium]
MNATRGQGRGGFAPSAQGAAGRGFVLIGVAVVIGLLLLWRGLDSGGSVDVETGDGGTDVAADGGTDAADAGTTDAGTDAATDAATDAGTDAATDGSTDAVSDGGTDAGGATSTTAATGTTRPPEQVTVLVANGSGTSGAAGTVSDKLKAVNFNTLEPANATPTTTSKVYYRPGYDQDAQEVARVVGATADLVLPVPDPTGVADNAVDRATQANVIVILGSDGRIPTS